MQQGSLAEWATDASPLDPTPPDIINRVESLSTLGRPLTKSSRILDENFDSLAQFLAFLGIVVHEHLA